MIRTEAVILSVFGAIIGIIIGTGMGAALATSLKSQGITDTVIPGVSLVVFLVIAGLLGLVAAWFPAWRAGQARRAGGHLLRVGIRARRYPFCGGSAPAAVGGRAPQVPPRT